MIRINVHLNIHLSIDLTKLKQRSNASKHTRTIITFNLSLKTIKVNILHSQHHLAVIICTSVVYINGFNIKDINLDLKI